MRLLNLLAKLEKLYTSLNKLSIVAFDIDYIGQKIFVSSYVDANVCFVLFVLFAIFILHSRESKLYRYTLDGKSALAWELPFSRFTGHLSST